MSEQQLKLAMLKAAACVISDHAWLCRFRQAGYENKFHEMSPDYVRDVAMHVDQFILLVKATCDELDAESDGDKPALPAGMTGSVPPLAWAITCDNPDGIYPLVGTEPVSLVSLGTRDPSVEPIAFTQVSESSRTSPEKPSVNSRITASMFPWELNGTLNDTHAEHAGFPHEFASQVAEISKHEWPKGCPWCREKIVVLTLTNGDTVCRGCYERGKETYASPDAHPCDEASRATYKAEQVKAEYWAKAKGVIQDVLLLAGGFLISTFLLLYFGGVRQ